MPDFFSGNFNTSVYINGVYVGTTTTGSTFTGSVFTGSRAPAPPRPRLDEHREWLRQTLGFEPPLQLDPKESQRVRTYLERLGFSPAVPFDPAVARSTFRRLMRENHPDAGGDLEETKRLTNAWNELKARGFVR